MKKIGGKKGRKCKIKKKHFEQERSNVKRDDDDAKANRAINGIQKVFA